MGLSSNEILQILTDYYASFDKTKRGRFEISALGAPLGDPKAPVTFLEFADFDAPSASSCVPSSRPS